MGHDPLLRRSAVRFGEAEKFGVHHFRYCIASFAPLVMPESPGIAAAVLRITETVLDEHYDRSSAVLAIRKYHQAIEDELRATQHIAQEVFRERRQRLLNRLRQEEPQA